jgi:hypothetical protein
MTADIQQHGAGLGRGHLHSIALIAVFDIAGPLVAYSLLRSAGLSTVSALVLSGIFPVLGVATGFIRRRRVDPIGALVLLGIAVGSVLGLVTGDPRLVLAEGSVPTALFGLACLGSLLAGRPLLFRIALEFAGADTPRGREFEARWARPEFRHVFRVITTVWGLAYLAEAAARVVIAETAPAGTALAVSKTMPYLVAAALTGWMISYGRWARRRGEQAAAAAAARAATAAQAAIPAQAGTTAQAVRTDTAAPRPDGLGPACQRPAGVLL